MTDATGRPDEFGFIATYLAPLAEGCEGALGLKDDAALFSIPPGQSAVVTSDALIAGTHFRITDPADSQGAKALGVNLSDLASMGATPLGYTLILALPPDWTTDWAQGFTAGLAEYQDQYGIKLLGGDTVAIDGPLTIGVTAIGSVPGGGQLTRSGAAAGDDVWVSGTIGDAALALALSDRADRLSAPDYAHLLTRFERPRPRLALGRNLIGLASAAIDVSDGLAADLGHLGRASGIGAVINVESLPLSGAARRCIEKEKLSAEIVLSGGDDYELLFTAPPQLSGAILAAAEKSECAVSRIGNTNAGDSFRFIGKSGEDIDLQTSGWTHF